MLVLLFACAIDPLLLTTDDLEGAWVSDAAEINAWVFEDGDYSRYAYEAEGAPTSDEYGYYEVVDGELSLEPAWHEDGFTDPRAIPIDRFTGTELHMDGLRYRSESELPGELQPNH